MCFVMFVVYLKILSGKIITPCPLLSRRTISNAPSKIRPELGPADLPFQALPPGIQAPTVVQFNASSVPVLQISLSSDTLSEQQLYDYGIYRIR